MKDTEPTKAAGAASLVDEHEIARILGMSLAWVRKDRRTKRLIPFTRLGAAVRYNPQQILAQLASQSEGGVSAGKGARR